MKKLFFIILLPLCARSQTITSTQNLGAPTINVHVKGVMQLDTAIFFPSKDTTYTPAFPYAITFRPADHRPYFWDGTQWRKFLRSGDVTGSTTIIITNNIVQADTTVIATRRYVDSNDNKMTLQRVFNTEVGGSVLTKNDTVLVNSRQMNWIATSGGYSWYTASGTYSWVLQKANGSQITMQMFGALNQKFGISSQGYLGGVNSSFLILDTTKIDLLWTQPSNFNPEILLNSAGVAITKVISGSTTLMNNMGDSIVFDQASGRYRMRHIPATADTTLNKPLTVDANGTIKQASWYGGGGVGNVTSFSAGTLSPLFTTSVATATTTPALTFNLTNAAAHTLFGNSSSSSAAPTYVSVGFGLTWSGSTILLDTANIKDTVYLLNQGAGMITGYVSGTKTINLENFQAGAGITLTKNVDSSITVAATGASGLTRQAITSGSSGTVTGGNYLITFNPGSVLASYTLTLPASPADLDVVEIEAGGTVTSGNPVVTSLTISPNSGQTLVQAATPTTIDAGEYIKYRYRAANTRWYREN